VETNDQDPLDLEGFQMISLGWTNPTPWNTFRELPQNELAESSTSTPRRTAADSTKRRAWTKTST
jgi:Icc-related predicted phosphoesterase